MLPPRHRSQEPIERDTSLLVLHPVQRGRTTKAMPTASRVTLSDPTIIRSGSMQQRGFGFACTLTLTWPREHALALPWHTKLSSLTVSISTGQSTRDGEIMLFTKEFVA